MENHHLKFIVAKPLNEKFGFHNIKGKFYEFIDNNLNKIDYYAHTDSIVGDGQIRMDEPHDLGMDNFFMNYDMPRCNSIRNKALCGYVTPDGTYYKCEHCEHEKYIRQLVYEHCLDEYMNTDIDFYARKPVGMFQEEYFAMKKMHWVKISTFADQIDEAYAFTYGLLTGPQSDIIYAN